MPGELKFLMTVDVESFSIPRNRCDEEAARQVYRQGLPRVLDVFSRYDVLATFYFTGEFAAQVPEAIDLVKENQHEIGCHGYYHEVDRAFDMLSLDEQVADLKKAKVLIESVAGRIASFRAPALRINENTARALEITGFTSDSSVCPQRFDGPFTFGSRQKLRWFFAHRMPYFLDQNCSVLEIPISALLVPYIGTTMRISPSAIRMLEKVLFFESNQTGRPIVFIFHPNECLDFHGDISPTRRTNNPVQSFFADTIRQRLKVKNLGERAVLHLANILSRARRSGFTFITASELRKYY